MPSRRSSDDAEREERNVPRANTERGIENAEISDTGTDALDQSPSTPRPAGKPGAPNPGRGGRGSGSDSSSARTDDTPFGDTGRGRREGRFDSPGEKGPRDGTILPTTNGAGGP